MSNFDCLGLYFFYRLPANLQGFEKLGISIMINRGCNIDYSTK